MFKFLKLFRKQEPVLVSMNDLEKWFEQQVGLSQAPVNAKLERLKTRFSEVQERLRENLENLRNTQLKNPKISTREIQFMEGNREAYIKKVKLLSEHLKFPEVLPDIPRFHDSFSQQLAQFGKSSAKSYYIMQEFFANESRNVALRIKDLEQHVLEAKSLHQQFMDASHSRLKAKISSLISLREKKKSLLDDKNSLNQQIERQKVVLAELAEKRKKILESPEYNTRQSQEQELEQLSSQQKEKERELLHQFSVIEHALKKYAKISYEHQELAESYLAEPVKALAKDFNLDIIKLLQKMTDAIEREEVELKDKKRQKTLSTIKGLTQAFFTSFRSSYNGLLVKKKGVEQLIAADSTQDQLRHLEFSIKNSNSKLESLEEHLKLTEQKIEDVDIKARRKELQQSLSELLKRPIEISDNSVVVR